jgi:N-acetyldiaminopimelate deacetylase
MTGEDFGFFTTLYPSLLFWLGAGETEYDLHSDRFLPDENCIPVGVRVMGEIIQNLEL